MEFIGIDPGLSGAVVVIDDAQPASVHVYDTPSVEVVRNGKKRRDYLISEMAGILRGHQLATMVVLEKVSAMPGQGVSSMFSFGRGLGIWEGVLAALKIPVTLVAPVTWKKSMMADMDKSSKDSSRIRAIQLFPNVAETLKRRKDHGRAEALLMAEYARRIHQGQ